MQYLKALVGAAIAGLGTLATALSDGSIEMIEWVWVAIAFLTALGGIWAVPNGATPPTAAERADFEERLVAGNVRKVGGYQGGTATTAVTKTNGGTGQNVTLPPPQ